MLQPHIQLDESLNCKYAILPGDPARVDRIAKYLDNVQELAFNREYKSVRGTYKGVPIVAISTGIGGPSATIALEELRRIGVTHCIRIGSCGAFREGIGLGDLILVSGAVRDDGTSKSYVPLSYPAVPDTELLMHCIESVKERNDNYHLGIVRTHDSFYVDNIDEIKAFWAKQGVVGSDMETATVLTVGRLRGLKVASILNNVVVWGEDTSDSIGSYVGGEDLRANGEREEILVALEAFVKADQK